MLEAGLLIRSCFARLLRGLLWKDQRLTQHCALGSIKRTVQRTARVHIQTLANFSFGGSPLLSLTSSTSPVLDLLAGSRHHCPFAYLCRWGMQQLLSHPTEATDVTLGDCQYYVDTTPIRLHNLRVVAVVAIPR